MVNMEWQLSEANRRFSELMTQALTASPQRVRRRDQIVVVLSKADYQRLTGEGVTLKDSLLNGPNLSDLDLTRDPSPMREIAG
jgi:prevent-host-death family protein